MSIPPWGIRALEKFKPVPGLRDTEPDSARQRQWEGFRARFEKRWAELEPEKWKIPEQHPSYGRLLRNYIYPPADYVRECILEAAIECAWEMGANKSPEKVVDAVKELDNLNDQISEASAQLASLFRQRDQLREEYSLSDSSTGTETRSLDAFRLSELLEMVFSKSRFRTAGFRYKEGLNTLYDALSSSYGAPTIADLLDEISWRMPRTPIPFDAGDIAVMGSKTNRSEWSPWALRLVARLSTWADCLPGGFLLECLTYEQLATLLSVALDAPDNAYNAPQMRELVKRYKVRDAK